MNKNYYKAIVFVVLLAMTIAIYAGVKSGALLLTKPDDRLKDYSLNQFCKTSSTCLTYLKSNFPDKSTNTINNAYGCDSKGCFLYLTAEAVSKVNR